MYEVTEQNADVTAVYQAPQALNPGTSLNIGPFQLDVTEPGSADLALTIELVQALPENSKAVDKEVFFRATRLPVSRRLLAWALFLPILAWFLILPTLNFFFNNQSDAPKKITMGESRALHQVKRVFAIAGDGSWNPGELAAGHQAFASNCKACHSESFTRVKDADCKAWATMSAKKLATLPPLMQPVVPVAIRITKALLPCSNKTPITSWANARPAMATSNLACPIPAPEM